MNSAPSSGHTSSSPWVGVDDFSCVGFVATVVTCHCQELRHFSDPKEEGLNMDETAKLELKKKIVEEQMAKFWEFCHKAMEQYQEREDWERGDFSNDYSNDGRVIPDSVQEFSSTFLSRLTEMLKAI